MLDRRPLGPGFDSCHGGNHRIEPALHRGCRVSPKWPRDLTTGAGGLGTRPPPAPSGLTIRGLAGMLRLPAPVVLIADPPLTYHRTQNSEVEFIVG